MGIREGRFVSCDAKLRVSNCMQLYTPEGVEMDIQMDICGYMDCEGPMTREGTCQSLQITI